MAGRRALLQGLVLSALVLAAVCEDVAPPTLPYTQARIKWGVTAPAPGPLSRAKVAGSLVLTEFPLGTDFFSLGGSNPAWYGNAGGNNTAVAVKDTQVEFGYEDPLVVFNVDLTTQGVITVTLAFGQPNGYLTTRPLMLTLKSAAFSKFKLLEDVNSNFAAQVNATFSKGHDTITLRLAPQRGFPAQTFQAIYRLGQCEHGKCCDKETGLFKPAGVVCRPKKSSCDAAERCTGESRECPDDKDAADGAKCLWFSDYGKAGAMADRSTLKMSVLRAPSVSSKVRIASTTMGATDELLGEDEVCMGHCQHGVCYMAKKEAACCTPASGGGDEDGPDGPDDNGAGNGGDDGPDGPDDNGAGNGGDDGPDGPDDNGAGNDDGPDGPDDNGGARRRRRSQRSGRASIAAAASPTYYCWS